MDSRNYPEGRGNPVSRTFTVLPTSGVVLGNNIAVDFGIEKWLRFRATIAQVNAGLIALPALMGVRWQIYDMFLISVGGAVGAATTVDITGVQATSTVKLLAVAIAALTQSALVRAGAANATVLADGASFALNDANTAVNFTKTGASITTATHIDFSMGYVAQPA